MPPLRWVALLAVIPLLGCGPLSSPSSPSPGTPRGVEAISVPSSASRYQTDAAPTGVVGGPGGQELAAEIAAELTHRGNVATADGALAATASWILRELNEGRPLEQTSSEQMTRRYGFAGVVLSMAGFELNAGHAELWRDAIGRVPANLPITRFGVSVSDSGRSAAVVFGAVEVSLAPFPRTFAVNDTLALSGEVAPRFDFAHVYLTKPDGRVVEQRMPARRVKAAFLFDARGKYKLEVMGDGATGPVIVANVPLYVGMAEPESVNVVGHATSPSEGEARLFELLNRARGTAGLQPLLPDEQLRGVALEHSNDMAEHDFFGHVSPLRGDPESRLRRAGVAVSAYGENIAQADTPENAHESLMSSPGHRAVMLSPQFTHVGIAAVPAHSALVFTLVFARRADPASELHDAAQLEAAFLALRAKNGLTVPVSDDIYRVSAEAGLSAYLAAPTPTPEIAVAAMSAALRREVARTRTGRAGSCSYVGELLDAEQLAQNPALLAPGIRRYGLAAQERTDSQGTRLAILMVLEGAPCR